jgi:aldehyde dehydrogenase (NAD+)
MTPPMKPSTPAEISGIVARARAAFESGRTRPVAWRAATLRNLRAALRRRAGELVEAVAADFGKPAFEAWATEIGYTIAELDHVSARFARWARARRVPTPLLFQPGSSRVIAEPLGLTCVISTWNYPVQLLVMPMIAAIAAGNAVIGKPSELTPVTSAVLGALFGELDDPAVALVQGGSIEGAELLTHRFDHILYTGSGAVARTVMRAAAEHLTPVTLELGGKSPAIVTRHADVSLAARRIAWGKFFNAGQTCIAPDYVLVERAVHDDLVAALRECIGEFFGDDPEASPDLARIVSEHHFRRLGKLLDSGTIAAGGTTDAATLYVAPTILTDVRHDDPVMQEEIFGPILPVLPVSSLRAAIDIVRARDKPLALYVFSRHKRETTSLLQQVSSGGVCVNSTLLHVGNPYLPFGGVGQSGVGRYHGRYGFDTFSHLRGVYTRSTKIELAASYPPYTAAKQQLLRLGFALPEPRNVAAGLRSRIRSGWSGQPYRSPD